MELKEAILKRRSVRKFEDYHVTDEELNELMLAAQYAPSWANTQSASFIAIRDKEVMKDLVENCYPKNPASKCSLGASLILVACYEKNKSGNYRGFSFDTIGTWGMFDLGLACQNLMLRAYELGLGTVVVGAYDFEKAKSILNTPETHEIAAIIPVGKMTSDEMNVPPRKDIKELFTVL